MSESRVHLDGVARLERFVYESMPGRSDIVLYRDTPDSPAQKKPPMMGGFRPDVFARGWRDGTFIIGESKTPRDLRSERSHKQIASFIESIRKDSRGTFVLTVPFGALQEARALLHTLGGFGHDLDGRVHGVFNESLDIASPEAH